MIAIGIVSVCFPVAVFGMLFAAMLAAGLSWDSRHG